MLNQVICTQSENNNANENTEMIQENIENSNNLRNNEGEELSPGLRRRTSKTGVMSTPTKKPIRPVDLEMAAKKDPAFRDLKNKNINNA